VNLPRKYRIWVAALYSVYFSLSSWILNPFVFIEDHNPWITYASIFAISLLGCWLIMQLFANSLSSAISHLIVVASAFALSLSCGTLVWLFNDTHDADPFLYFNSFLILPILPVSIYILWLMYFDLNKRVVVSAEKQETTDQSIQKTFRIENNRNEIILESPIEKIIAFEANDNYVNTYHLRSDGTVDKVMHRISLKKITELLAQIDIAFLRVHKSYLINPNFIEKVKGRSQAYRIELTHLPIDVPVSRNFDIKSIQATGNT
jgi:hypothetical protein